MRSSGIRINIASAFKYMDNLGDIYRDHADAIKEYVNIALYSFFAHQDLANECRIDFILRSRNVSILCKIPGMNEYEFTDILQDISKPTEQNITDPTIRSLAVRLLGFYYFGKRLEILSKKRPDDITIKVEIQVEEDYAEINRARESQLSEPGMQFRIFNLDESPMSDKSSLSVSNLNNVLAEEFDSYLKERSLILRIFSKNKWHKVEPMPNGYTHPNNYDKSTHEEGRKGKGSIRHFVAPFIDKIEGKDSLAFARSTFKRDDTPIEFTRDIDDMRLIIKAEIDHPKKGVDLPKPDESYEKAINLAKTILQSQGIENPNWSNPIISTKSFDDAPFLHSRLKDNVIQINVSNHDYIKALNSSEEDFASYIALLIAKELIALEEKVNFPDKALEKMLTFIFAMKYK